MELFEIETILKLRTREDWIDYSWLIAELFFILKQAYLSLKLLKYYYIKNEDNKKPIKITYIRCIREY